MTTKYLPRPAVWASLLAMFLLLTVACAQATPTTIPAATPTATPVKTIKVSLLVEVSATDTRWYRNVELPKGADAWELTEAVTQGQVEAKYYALYRAHFVDAIFGVKGTDPKYWLLFVWSEADKKWEPSPVGADLYSLKDGHVLAWYYADTSKEGSLPTAQP